MSAEPAVAILECDWELLRLGQEVLRQEGAAVVELAGRLEWAFVAAAKLVYRCPGSVLVTGVGKAGLVGQKIAATFASLGTRSHFLHPTEALHGDLGRVQPGDVVLALSASGETEEILALCHFLRQWEIPIVAVTRRAGSTLGRLARITLEIGVAAEACPLGLAPTTSTTVMLALGDALAVAVARLKNFRAEDFARYHPGGSLGRKLGRVEQLMRPLEECRLAHAGQTVRQVLVCTSRPGRRTGAIMLVDDQGRLVGIFTDSDLARLFERRSDQQLDRPISEVMTRSPITIPAGSRTAEAVRILAERKISELPVVDAEGRPLGIIDVTDVVSLWPEDFPQFKPAGPAPSLSVCRPRLVEEEADYSPER
jgi:arabinose-5-phosphate isomerase